MTNWFSDHDIHGIILALKICGWLFVLLIIWVLFLFYKEWDRH